TRPPAVPHAPFLFSSRRRHTRSKRDWSSDVCSSDLPLNRHLMTTLEPGNHSFTITAPTRVDAAVAHAVGISRTKAVQWIERDLVTVGDVIARKSTKLAVGDTIIVAVPNDPDPLEVKAEVVQDLTVIADETDYVVVDKPVGVAAHPSQGWRGPTVVGGLAALGIRIATSGPPERPG